MAHFFAKAALAALIGLGGFGVTTTTASADTIRFGISDGGLSVQVRDHDRRGRHDRGWDRHDRRRGCAPWMATRKAERYGLRRANVVHMSRRSVVVEGIRRGRPVTISFANERGCPRY